MPEKLLDNASPERTISGVTTVRWEGDLTGRHSLAVVNRAIVNGLSKAGIRIELSPQTAGPYKLSPKWKVRDTPGDVDVTVRHGWPPNLDRDHRGKLVLWQPWEYGAIPREWAAFVNDVADEAWCYGTTVQRFYEEGGVAPEKVHTVPLGVDLATFHHAGKRIELPPAACTFLFVGGTLHRKGIDVLLQAWCDAFPHRDDVLLVIKGFGSKSFYANSSFDAMIAEVQRNRPLAPPLLYVDADVSDDELASLYRSCDVLVHPYRGEGFGLTAAEALACGTPVMVTQGGSTDDFVPADASWQIPSTRTVLDPKVVGLPETDGEAYWLEPDRGALVAAMREAAADTEARTLAAKAARVHRDSLSWKAGIDAAIQRVRVLANA